MRIWTMAAIGALALCTATGTAQATSIGSGTSMLRATAEATGVVEKIAYRRCWWRGDKRICRYTARYRYPYFAYYRPYSGSGSSPTHILGIRH
jgi:hypothetical protein